MVFALVHSPFLGPQSWARTHAVLEDLGEASRLLDLREAFGAVENFYAAFGAAAARQIDGPSILVVHSGAGALVPAIVNSARRLIGGAVFVDALLPHPGRSWFDTAPAALADRLRAEADADLAPAWPRWMSPGALARLVPDRSMRDALVRDAPRAPLAFLEEPAPILPDPPELARAYLQLSAGYDEEAASARGSGWPVERFRGHHLSIMTDPRPMAAAIIASRPA